MIRKTLRPGRLKGRKRIATIAKSKKKITTCFYLWKARQSTSGYVHTTKN